MRTKYEFKNAAECACCGRAIDVFMCRDDQGQVQYFGSNHIGELPADSAYCVGPMSMPLDIFSHFEALVAERENSSTLQ